MRDVPSLRYDDKLDVRKSPGRIAVWTDASVKNQRVGIGYLSNSGRFGVHAHTQQRHIVGRQGVAIAELCAIWKAIHGLPKDAPVIVHSDSQTALRYARNWCRGDMVFPPGYQITRTHTYKPTLLSLAELLYEDPNRYQFEWVRGHAGNPFNELADNLARLGIRYLNGQVPKASVKQTARLWTSQTLGLA